MVNFPPQPRERRAGSFVSLPGKGKTWSERGLGSVPFSNSIENADSCPLISLVRSLSTYRKRADGKKPTCSSSSPPTLHSNSSCSPFHISSSSADPFPSDFWPFLLSVNSHREAFQGARRFCCSTCESPLSDEDEQRRGATFNFKLISLFSS